MKELTINGETVRVALYQEIALQHQDCYYLHELAILDSEFNTENLIRLSGHNPDKVDLSPPTEWLFDHNLGTANYVWSHEYRHGGEPLSVAQLKYEAWINIMRELLRGDGDVTTYPDDYVAQRLS